MSASSWPVSDGVDPSTSGFSDQQSLSQLTNRLTGEYAFSVSVRRDLLKAC
jgi:hypothetical protein